MKVRAAGFEPAVCASASATVTYRTLGYDSTLSEPRPRRVIPGVSAVSTTLAVLILAAGCATVPTASIPIATSCLKSEPPALPQTTDEAAILRMDEYAATLLTWTERLELKAYATKADALLQACK